MTNAFEMLGIKQIKPTKTRKNGEQNMEAYFAIRKERRVENGRMSVVVNVDSDYLKSINWDLKVDRVNIGSNGTLMLIEPSADGSYAITSTENQNINKTTPTNRPMNRMSRSEIKIQWREDICKLPKQNGRWEIKLQTIASNDRTAIMFTIPNEIYIEKNSNNPV